MLTLNFSPYYIYFDADQEHVCGYMAHTLISAWKGPWSKILMMTLDFTLRIQNH